MTRTLIFAAAAGIPALCWILGCGGKAIGEQAAAVGSTLDAGGFGGGSSFGGGGGSVGSAGTAGTGGDPSCPGMGGPTMVQLPQGYCIDSTEVTRDQYAEWLGTTPSTGGQDSWCSWNTNFTPVCEWPPAGKGRHPVVCVTWCDAYAYCKAVGKRLCGKIGGGANGFIESGDGTDATKSQWYNACSSGGLHAYPYGGKAAEGTDGYESQSCNGTDNSATGCAYGVCTTVEVGTLQGCASRESAYGGVYDLSGNVWEWEDSCSGSTGKTDECFLRGGAFNDNYDGLRCDIPVLRSRGDALDTFGFRCCGP